MITDTTVTADASKATDSQAFHSATRYILSLRHEMDTGLQSTQPYGLSGLHCQSVIRVCSTSPNDFPSSRTVSARKNGIILYKNHNGLHASDALFYPLILRVLFRLLSPSLLARVVGSLYLFFYCSIRTLCRPRCFLLINHSERLSSHDRVV